MILFFDTETTGLPDWKSPSDAPNQPHLVQLAMILTDDDLTERACVNLIIRPEGWDIPADVAAIHGITTDIASRCGVQEKIAVGLFDRMVPRNGLLVAHNISFDQRIIRIARLRSGWTKPELQEEEKKPTFCTMAAATPLVNLPPTDRMIAAGFSKPKPPKLAECIKHFYGEELAGAHDALVDVRACMRVYAALRLLEEDI